ncbi:MAG: lipocalin family protein [Acidobacteriota bacterium]|nr:lipocalin family protein [Acidobacteriota bacterium]
MSDFAMQLQAQAWTNPTTQATYPIAWRVAVPSLGIDLQVGTQMTSQELVSQVAKRLSYWEGAITIAGTRNGAAAKGVGYLEMTGYSPAAGSKLAPQK